MEQRTSRAVLKSGAHPGQYAPADANRENPGSSVYTIMIVPHISRT